MSFQVPRVKGQDVEDALPARCRGREDSCQRLGGARLFSFLPVKGRARDAPSAEGDAPLRGGAHLPGGGGGQRLVLSLSLSSPPPQPRTPPTKPGGALYGLDFTDRDGGGCGLSIRSRGPRGAGNRRKVLPAAATTDACSAVSGLLACHLSGLLSGYLSRLIGRVQHAHQRWDHRYPTPMLFAGPRLVERRQPTEGRFGFRVFCCIGQARGRGTRTRDACEWRRVNLLHRGWQPSPFCRGKVSERERARERQRERGRSSPKPWNPRGRVVVGSPV